LAGQHPPDAVVVGAVVGRVVVGAVVGGAVVGAVVLGAVVVGAVVVGAVVVGAVVVGTVVVGTVVVGTVVGTVVVGTVVVGGGQESHPPLPGQHGDRLPRLHPQVQPDVIPVKQLDEPQLALEKLEQKVVGQSSACTETLAAIPPNVNAKARRAILRRRCLNF